MESKEAEAKTRFALGLAVPGPGEIEKQRSDNMITSKTCIKRIFTSRGPLDGVDLLGVGLEVVDAGVLVHAPNLEGHVVGAGGQELALGIPLDRVDLEKQKYFRRPLKGLGSLCLVLPRWCVRGTT